MLVRKLKIFYTGHTVSNILKGSWNFVDNLSQSPRGGGGAGFGVKRFCPISITFPPRNARQRGNVAGRNGAAAASDIVRFQKAEKRSKVTKNCVSFRRTRSGAERGEKKNEYGK